MDSLVLTTQEQIAGFISEAIKNELRNYKIVDKNKSVGDEEEYITFNEALMLLKISRPTLFKRMNDHTIPFRRVGKRLLFPKKRILLIIEAGANSNNKTL